MENFFEKGWILIHSSLRLFKYNVLRFQILKEKKINFEVFFLNFMSWTVLDICLFELC